MSDRRQELIKQLETSRNSRVIAYVTGDRSPATAAIGDDTVRPILEVLRALPATDTLDVFLYSRGGAIDVPWRLATAFRQAAKTWRLLVPFRANSAATLLALGADTIVLGRHGELGPIDPRFVAMSYDQAGRQIQSEIAVEDVMAYIRFLKDRAGLSDQAALTSGISKLAERIDPVMLGNIY